MNTDKISVVNNYITALSLLINRYGVKLDRRIDLYPLAWLLSTRTGCHIKTARLIMRRVLNRARMGFFEPPPRGGIRPGAGRPRKGTE